MPPEPQRRRPASRTTIPFPSCTVDACREHAGRLRPSETAPGGLIRNVPGMVDVGHPLDGRVPNPTGPAPRRSRARSKAMVPVDSATVAGRSRRELAQLALLDHRRDTFEQSVTSRRPSTRRGDLTSGTRRRSRTIALRHLPSRGTGRRRTATSCRTNPGTRSGTCWGLRRADTREVYIAAVLDADVDLRTRRHERATALIWRTSTRSARRSVTRHDVIPPTSSTTSSAADVLRAVPARSPPDPVADSARDATWASGTGTRPRAEVALRLSGTPPIRRPTARRPDDLINSATPPTAIDLRPSSGPSTPASRPRAS